MGRKGESSIEAKGYKTTMIEELIHKIYKYNPKADTGLIKKAYDFASKVHQGQMRESGVPYLSHPMEVAEILVQMKLDVPSVVAGILHDTAEDTKITVEEIKKEFGAEIEGLVDGVTNIGKIKFKTREERDAENFRKVLLSMVKDIRVILIKLADRLHNMRTLESLPEVRRKRIAQETLDIYVPLANRLGIYWMKAELEDLCFRYLKPDVYLDLAKKVAKKREERDRFIKEVIDIVTNALAENELKGRIEGRSKHLYSIYSKMERQGITFDEVYDLAALRIATDTKANCYSILGMIHSLWKPVPGRFKDYIGVPKSNMYQSLHTTVIGPKGERVEFQIRTEEMHKIAEEGIAAHWKYKEKGQIDKKDDRLFTWLRQVMEWQQDLTDSQELLKTIKVDLFPDAVYVFTPKGDVKELIKGSTPIDFAYAIHTEVGHHCVGAKVNGKLVPLKYQLRSGDTVEVLTSPTHVPSRDWLKIVKTPKAKARVKQWIKAEEHKRSIYLGRKLLERELRKHHLSPIESLKAEKLQDVAQELGVSDIDGLMVAIGYGKISAHQVVNRLLPEGLAREKVLEKIEKRAVPTKGVKIKGIDDILVRLSKCCNPVPGDKIIGFITRGRGLSIHTADCPNIDELDYDKDRMIDVEWDLSEATVHPVKISVLTEDKPGLLASVSASITSAEANISHAEVTTTEDKKATLNFVVDIHDLAHLQMVLQKIEQVDGVIRARRVRPG